MEPSCAAEFHALWAWTPAGKIRSVPDSEWDIEVYRRCLENLRGVRWGLTTARLLVEAVLAASEMPARYARPEKTKTRPSRPGFWGIPVPSGPCGEKPPWR
jgi:hypothetical protein